MTSVVTVSGLAGSGTTTASRLLAERLGTEHVYAGRIFRETAAERGLTLQAFNEQAEADPGIDRVLDDAMADRAARGGCVLEGRLSGFVVARAGIGAFTVWLECDEHERARRVAEREGITAAEALASNRARESSERRRYRDIYGWDVDDLTGYDLVLDSGTLDPDEIVARIPGPRT